MQAAGHCRDAWAEPGGARAVNAGQGQHPGAQGASGKGTAHTSVAPPSPRACGRIPAAPTWLHTHLLPRLALPLQSKRDRSPLGAAHKAAGKSEGAPPRCTPAASQDCRGPSSSSGGLSRISSFKTPTQGLLLDPGIVERRSLLSDRAQRIFPKESREN